MSEKPQNQIEISKLKFPEYIREKPGMYIGETTHPTTIVRELIDNSLDEAMNNYAKKVNIIIDNKSNYSVIQDDGRGIPIYLDEDYLDEDREITISLFSETHVSGKFQAQEVSTGTHGVGAKATNALSDSFIIIVNCDKMTTDKVLPKWIKTELKDKNKQFYILSFKGGYFINSRVLTKDELKVTLSEGIDLFERLPEELIEKITTSDWWSSTAICKPDSTIFESIRCRYDIRSLKLTKLFNNHIDIIYNGEEVTPYNFNTDSFEGVKLVGNKHFEMKFDYNTTFQLRGVDKELKSTWYINFGYSQEDFSTGTDASVNTLGTKEGYHVRLIGRFLAQAFRELYPILSADDYKYGIRYFTLVFTNYPEYTAQDKTKLGRIYGIDEYKLYHEYFKPQFIKLTKAYPDEFEGIVNRIIEYKRAMGKLAVKDFVNSVVIMGDDKRSRGMGDIIMDCSSRDRENAELFIVEGRSAGGCFRSGTKIKTLNRGDIKIEEVTYNDWVLTSDSKGAMLPAKINKSFITKYTSDLVRVTLDTSEFVECTPDHKFQLRSGDYKEAKDLESGESLMPYYEKLLSCSVKSVESIKLNFSEPVWDLEVNHENHNFPLSIGVMVHNSIQKCRNTKNQALLPLRGKVLNVSNLEIEDALNNREILAMINGIGVGIHPFTDLSKRRYGKIIIATDADVDGSHIALLICGAFATFLPEVIQEGMLYIALAPLYEQKVKGKPVYYWEEKDLDPKLHTLRFKGLGSADAYVIEDTVVNPKTRKLIKVTMKDAENALILLRDKNARRELMIKEGILVLEGDKSFDYDAYEDLEDSIQASNDGFSYDEVKELEGGEE